MTRDTNTEAIDSLWEQSVIAAQAGNTVQVLAILQSLAEKGVWQALARIGELYEIGGGNLEKDPDKAIQWYRRSIFECDDPVAHLGLGRFYYNGTSVDRDFGKSYMHFQKASLSHLPEANLYIGIMMYSGTGTKKDIEKATKYFTMAAASDFCIAFLYLARIHFRTGHLIKAIACLFKARAVATRLGQVDPNDRRLMGMTSLI